MKNLLFLFCFCLSFHNGLFAEDFKKFNNKVDSETSLSKLELFKKEEKQKYQETKDKYYLYNVKYIEATISNFYNSPNERLKKLTWIIEDCGNSNSEQIAWINYHLASQLAILNGDLSTEYALTSLRIAKKENYKEILSLDYALLATIDYNKKKFASAISYYQKAIKTDALGDNIFKASMMNNIGLCHMNLQKNQEAYSYFKRSEAAMKKLGSKSEYDTHFLIVVQGNVGTILDKLGKYDSSIHLLEKEVSYYFNHRAFIDESINPLIELLNLYNKLNKEKEEQVVLGKIKYLEKLYDKKVIQPKLTEALYRYYNSKKNDAQAVFYATKLVDKLNKYSDKIAKQTKELNEIMYYDKMSHLKIESNSQKKLLEHAVSDKRQSQFISLILVIAVLLVLTIAYIVIQGKNKRAKKDSIIFQQAKQIDINKSVILENEIQLQQDKINSLAMNLNLKKETEKAFLSKIKEIKKRKNVDIEEVIKDLQLCVNNLLQIDEKMLSSTIETDEINRRFKSLLVNKHPDLSKNDLNFCCYFRLNLSSKEIGSLHQISDVSVRVLKNKIKNKIGLNHTESLNNYLTEFNI